MCRQIPTKACFIGTACSIRNNCVSSAVKQRQHAFCWFHFITIFQKYGLKTKFKLGTLESQNLMPFSYLPIEIVKIKPRQILSCRNREINTSPRSRRLEVMGSGGSRGGARGVRPPPTYFQTKKRPEGPKKIFLEAGPPRCLRVWVKVVNTAGSLDWLAIRSIHFLIFL